MNSIDVLLILVVLLAVWSGYKRGFILGLMNLITWLGSLLLGFLVYPYLGSLIERFLPLGVWTQPVAFLLAIFLFRALLSLIMNRILQSTTPEMHQRPVNKALGVFPGLVNGGIYALILSALLLALPISDGLSAKTRESGIASRLADEAEWANAKLSPVFDEAVSRTMNRMTVDPKSRETVTLHFKVADPKVREDLESKMLQLVNEERKKEGLKPLKADPEIAVVARAHSRDMFARGYFSHETPEGKSPFDRMRLGGIRFLAAGENLALGQTLTICHTGLMNSPGHRANILHKSFGRLGIGVLDGGIYGLMITQNFRN